MNESSSPQELPPPPPLPKPVDPRRETDWAGWIRRLLVCNPFFLCSAALLLYGLNRLSVDPSFLEREESKLLFNFTALQLYQFLVVGTALVLARRHLWYDSALLVVVDNGLALVPFMLVSQAAMIDRTLGGVFVGIGVTLCIGRYLAIKRGYSSFNLPSGLAWVGLAIVTVNVLLPLRLQSVVSATTVYEWEPYNEAFWLYVLPALIALVNLIGRPKTYGGLNQQRHWLPIFLATLWLTATALHAWSCAYIGKQVVTAPMLVGVAVVAAWTFWNRLTDFLEEPPNVLRAVAMFAPLGSGWLAAGNPKVFAGIMAANAAAYGWIAFKNPVNRAPALLAAYAAGTCAIIGLPLEIIKAIAPFGHRSDWIALIIGGQVMIVSVLKFAPFRGVMGGICAGIGAANLIPGVDANLAWQIGGLFVVLHSLLWNEGDLEIRAQITRYTGLAVWFLTAISRDDGHDPDAATVQVIAGVLLGAAWWLVWRVRHPRFLLQIPVAATVITLWPAAVWIIRHGSVGILALGASLLLFASGCALAWTRSRWER